MRSAAPRSFFPSRLAVASVGLLFAASLAAQATLPTQNGPLQPTTTTSPTTDTTVAGQTVNGNSTVTTDAQGQKTESASISFSGKKKKKKAAKADKVVESKDTRAENRRATKMNPLAGKDANLPDKALYDKALDQVKKGHFDVARLDLETLLNTYPDSQYQMRAKIAIADSWYREGGTAALTQAEQEYTDFITFFPNVPEAAEAQLRVGDIYFKQLDVPDRDYTKAVKAEAAYRTMLKQYPDSKLDPEARQKLREVQELLATREATIGAFYATHNNWPATIARYQTVVDTYPQYSHMDDVLIGIGDAYAAQAKFVRAQATCGPTQAPHTPCLPEAAKAKLVQEDDARASAEYRRVVMDHAAAPHVEDAKERLTDMGQPLPTPTPAEVAASEELEGSRAQYNLQRRLAVMFLRRPDVVTAARMGEPLLDDPAVTVAPAIVRQQQNDMMAALNPAGAANAAHEAALHGTAPVTDAGGTPAADAPAAVPAPAGPVAAPVLGDVPSADADTSTRSSTVMSESVPSGAPATGVGVEVITPGVAGSSATPSSVPAATPADHAAAVGAQDPNYGLKTVGPANTAPLPAREAPAPAPDQVNDVAGKATPAAQAVDPNSKKNPKPEYDKGDESSSKHKKKKGIDKLNPF